MASAGISGATRRGARRIGALGAAALLAGAALAAAPAVRAVVAGGAGALPGGCVRDASRQSASERLCAIPAVGLLGASGIAASRDGRDVYVASRQSSAIVALSRSGRGGALHPIVEPSNRSCVQAPGSGSCSRRAPGLAGADAVAVSPDGRNVYAGSLDSAAVVALERTRGGLLSPIGGRGGCVQGLPVAAGAGGHCAIRYGAIEAVGSLAVSGDGRFVYALSFGSSAGADSLVTLARNPRSGALAPVPDARGGCVVALVSHSCRVHAAGLRGASAVVVSPDDRTVYVASQFSSAVVAFVRNRSTGTLRPLPGGGGCVADAGTSPPGGDRRCVQSTAGLGGARALAVSPDGRFVYVAAFDPGAVTVLVRDPATGGIAPATGAGSCLVPTAPPRATTGPAPPGPCAAVDGLRGAVAIALASGGRAIYVATTTGNSLLRIARDPAGGLLGAVAPSHPIGGLNAPAALALSRDGRNAYLASPIDDTLLSLAATP